MDMLFGVDRYCDVDCIDTPVMFDWAGVAKLKFDDGAVVAG